MFVVNSNLQLEKDGKVVPPEEYFNILIPGHLGNIPIPDITEVSDQQNNPCIQLYSVLREELPWSTFMSAVMLGGKNYILTVQLQLQKGQYFHTYYYKGTQSIIN